jgi:hypothetical protein
LLLNFLFFLKRGKRKLAQVTKEAKEQLADLQSKLEMANVGKLKIFFSSIFLLEKKTLSIEMM